MRFTLGVIALLGLLTLLAFFTSGCANIEKALQVAEETRVSMEEAGAELRAALEVAEQAREAYVDALKEGDGDKVAATLAALQKAEAEARERDLKFEASQKAAKDAEQQLEKAKAEGNYLEAVLGLIFGGIIGGGGGFLSGRKKRDKPSS